jgi:hypothetical protein
MLIVRLVLWVRGKTGGDGWKLLLVEATVSFSFLFWLFSSPLIRYGCVYVYLTTAITAGSLYEILLHGQMTQWKKRTEHVCLLFLTVFLLYKFAAWQNQVVHSFVNDYWIWQKDYENFETIAYTIEGETFYYSAGGDQTGYDSFPSSPAEAQIGFLGDTISDGFYSMINKN